MFGTRHPLYWGRMPNPREPSHVRWCTLPTANGQEGSREGRRGDSSGTSAVGNALRAIRPGAFQCLRNHSRRDWSSHFSACAINLASIVQGMTRSNPFDGCRRRTVWGPRDALSGFCALRQQCKYRAPTEFPNKNFLTRPTRPGVRSKTSAFSPGACRLEANGPSSRSNLREGLPRRPTWSPVHFQRMGK
jgi:hypothetical protein